MRFNATRRFVSIAPVVLLLTAPGSALAGDGSPTDVPVPPEIASPRFDVPEGKSLKSAGIAFYVAGALYDLYTTKRAMDAGLQESNPLLDRSGEPNRTLATAAVAKVGLAFVIGRAGRRGTDRSRGAWFLSCGILQLGAGFVNRNATIQARDAYAERTTVGIVTRSPGPSPKDGLGAFDAASGLSAQTAAAPSMGMTPLEADGLSPSPSGSYRVRK